MLVSDIVRRNAYFFPDDDAIVVPDGPTRSWSELEERSSQLANAFLDIGLEKGDRLAVFAPNCAEYIEFFFACAKSGVIGVPLNVRLAPAELTSFLDYVKPAGLMAHGALEEEANKFIGEPGTIEHIIGVGQGHGRDLDYDELVDAQDTSDPGVDIHEDDTYQLGPTSGTTGIPKGAILTHKSAIAAQMNWMAEIPIPEKGTNLQNIPLFFNPGGPAGMHPVLLKGGRTVVFPRFDPATFLKAVPEYGVTHTILVPTMIGMVVSQPDVEDYDLSTIQGVACGGSPLSPDLLSRARELFGDVFFPHYGMAETYSCGLVLRRQNQITDGTEAEVRRLGSAGKPNMLVQVKVVDDDGNDIPWDNETGGEIWLRGDTVTPGYFNMPEETEDAFEGDWLKTGDIATVDEEGFVTIVDRKKDIIITGGINVYSREVEDAISAHPDVLQVAVVGIPHEKWGEAVHGVVVLQPDAEATPEEIQGFAAERLADYKKPRSIEIVDELPIGGTGKIQKKELREEYWQDEERRV